MANKIAYIMSRFPHLPETFILREMTALEQQGWQIALFPLIRQSQAVLHKDAETWGECVQYAPFLSLDVLKANIKFFLKMPLGCLKIWLRVFVGNLSSVKFLLRALILFPKAVLMANQMEGEGVQHIHAHYATHPALVAWIIYQLTGISYSVTIHAHDIFVVKAMLETKLSDAEFVVAISDFNRRYLGEIIGQKIQEKIHVIHCGIEPSWYQQRQVEYEISAEHLEIISIGSLELYKGQIYLLEACALLKDRGISCRCRIIGEGEQRPRLERLIEARELQDDVLLLGGLPQEKVAQLLPTAHCYVQPSVIASDGKMEGIPVALMEAYASGLPVIATDLSGIPELVRPGETGFLVPHGDAAALADAIEEIYYDLEYAKSLAVKGRDLVLDEFDLSKNVKLLASLFRQMINIK